MTDKFYFSIILAIFIFAGIIGITACDTRESEEENVILSLEADPDSTYLDEYDTGCEITATLTTEDGEPITDTEICFDVYIPNTTDTLGIVNPKCDKTNVNGVAYCWFWTTMYLPINKETYADITATWNDISKTVEIRIIPVPPQSMSTSAKDVH